MGRRHRLAPLVVLILAFAALLPGATAAAEPGTRSVYTSYTQLQVKYYGSPTGHITIWWHSEWNYTDAEVCLVDNVRNGKGIWAQFTGSWVNGPSVSTGRFFSGWGAQKPYGQEYCTTFGLRADMSHFLSDIRIDKGNYWGSTVVFNDADVYPNPTQWSGPNLSIWVDEVAMRYGGEPNCSAAPSTANCPLIKQFLHRNDVVNIGCQKWGAETVGGNPYWVFAQIGSEYDDWKGWIPSYYVNYPYNWIDGLGYC